METDEQSSAENNVNGNGESDDKPKEEEAEAAPAVKHLEENESFSEFYLVHIYSVIDPYDSDSIIVVVVVVVVVVVASQNKATINCKLILA